MLLGRTGRAAAAVAAGTAANQQDRIPRLRLAAPDMRAGRSANNSADFHAFGNKAFIIDLRHLTGSESNLIAVGTVTRPGAQGNLALGQLARQSRFQRRARIAAAAYTHRLIYVRTP